jgi:hypothetical protein
MISNKTTLTLLFILSIIPATFASASNILETSLTERRTPQVKKRKIVSKVKENAIVLQDAPNEVEDVQAGYNIVMTDLPQVQPAPVVNKQLKEFLEQEKYDEIEKRGDELGKDEFLKQICPLLATFDQYKGLIKYFESHKMVADFFVCGNIEIVREAVFESKLYDSKAYVFKGHLETAAVMAFKGDHHDRVIDLLVIRQEAGAGADAQRMRGTPSRFEIFMSIFVNNLKPEENAITLKRFLTFHGEEFRSKHSGIFELFLQKLVNRLTSGYVDPLSERLLIDLVGQPSLLTPTIFISGFPFLILSDNFPNFIKYGWREAFLEARKMKCIALTQTGTIELPGKISHMSPDEILDYIFGRFPTKQDREDTWFKENALLYQKNLECLDFYPIPAVLLSLISQYVVSSWLDTCCIEL